MTKHRGCGNCFFKRTQFVGTRGNPEAPIVFVGESPGAMELKNGVPFVGPSGKVLTDCLPDTMTENDFYITNTLSCLPRKVNDVKQNHSRLQHATECCKGRLFEELAAHPRQVIVAMGNAALWALTGDTSLKITKERGSLIASEFAERGIIPCVHPAFLLRGGGSFRKFKNDIEYAIDLAKGFPAKEPVIPSYVVAENPGHVIDFIDYTFDTAERMDDWVLGADIETGGFDFQRDEVLSLGWCVDEHEVFIVPEELCSAELLSHRSFSRSRRYDGPFKWLWHNGKFDIKFLRRLGLPSGVDEDTMLLSYSMEENRGYHDLEQVASDEVGAPDYKDMLAPYLPNKKTSYREIPKPVLNKYLALDVAHTKQSWRKMHARCMSDTKNSKLYTEVLLEASELLADVETDGMLVDFDAVDENERYYLSAMEPLEETMNEISAEHVGKGINPRSPKQISELIYEHMKLGNPVKGTGKDVLKELPQVPFVAALQEYRNLSKAYGTYVKSLREQVGPDGRVHSTYLIHGTPTGRLASRGPNMQNQPRGPRIRKQFVAAPGYVLSEMDLDQAELRCLAALSGDQAMCEVYETGRKLHHEVSIQLWGDKWPEYYKLEDQDDPLYLAAKENYMRTKALNFGIVYGREAPSVADEFGVSVLEAQSWIDGWAHSYPDAWKYIGKCRMAPVKGQNIVTPFGRRKRAGVVSREKLRDLQNEAANFPHQSIASDITLMAAAECRPTLKKWGVKIVNLVHDAIIVEIPDDRRTICNTGKYVTSTMERVPIDWGIDRIPFSADMKVGSNWADLKDYDFAS